MYTSRHLYKMPADVDDLSGTAIGLPIRPWLKRRVNGAAWQSQTGRVWDWYIQILLNTAQTGWSETPRLSPATAASSTKRCQNCGRAPARCAACAPRAVHAQRATELVMRIPRPMELVWRGVPSILYVETKPRVCLKDSFLQSPCSLYRIEGVQKEEQNETKKRKWRWV